jgi:hypothetical protein
MITSHDNINDKTKGKYNIKIIAFADCEKW